MRARAALRTLVVAAATAVLLTGCVKLDVDLHVRSDNKLDGSLTVGISKSLAGLVPGGAANIGQILGSDQADIQGADSVKTQPFQDDKFVGETIVFTGAPLEQAANGAGATPGNLTITHDGNRYRLDGTLDLTTDELNNVPGGAPPGVDVNQLFAQAEVRVKVSFPGRVTQSNGSVSGCAVTWQPKFGAEATLTAVAKDSGGCTTGLRWYAWPLFGLGLLVLAGAAVAIVLLIRKERRDNEAKADTAAAAEAKADAAAAAESTAAGVDRPDVDSGAAPPSAQPPPPTLPAPGSHEPAPALAPPAPGPDVAPDAGLPAPPPGSPAAPTPPISTGPPPESPSSAPVLPGENPPPAAPPVPAVSSPPAPPPPPVSSPPAPPSAPGSSGPDDGA